MNESRVPVVSCEDFLPPLPRWLFWCGGGLMAFMTMVIALSAVFSYQIVVKAAATIRPDGELRVVQSAASGTVLQIHVKENQRVKRGELLVSLNDRELLIQLQTLNRSREEIQRQIKQVELQLLALLRRQNSNTQKVKAAVRSARVKLNDQIRTYQTQSIEGQSRTQEIEANLKNADAALRQAQSQLQREQANLAALRQELKSAKSKWDRYLALSSSGALPMLQIEEAQAIALSLQEKVTAQEAVVQFQRQDIQRKQQDIAALQAQQQRILASERPSSAEVEQSQESLLQEQAQEQTEAASLEQEEDVLKAQKINLQKELNVTEQNFRQTQINRANLSIRAPVDGTILSLSLRNPMQVVMTGSEIAKISPQNENLMVQSLVQGKDISQIVPGQAVYLRVFACPYPKFGTLLGKVTKVASDTIPNQSDSGTMAYLVTIEPQQTYLEKGKMRCQIQAGMETRADIVTRSETLLQTILKVTRLWVDL